MQYRFPLITSIDDVTPYLVGRDEFVVADKGDYIVINYNVGYEDTFNLDPDAPRQGAIRRECRGLIFYPDGRLMSRPFHKFFNVGEREETQVHNIDLSQPHVIMEKMDGSMIRPIMVGDDIRLATKMGVTDTSIAAEKILKDGQLGWMATMMAQGLTPLFEFVSPKNRIVVEYDRAELVLLAVRHNRTGEYFRAEDMDALRGNDFFPVVPFYGSVDGSFEDYIARQRGREGREGDIIAVGNMRYKIKNDWYVRIHKVKDKIRTDRHILALLLENELDDVYPHLDENDFRRVKLYEAAFHDAFKDTARILASDVGVVCGMAEDKKDLAVNVIPKSTLEGFSKQLAFRVYDRMAEAEFNMSAYVNEELMKHVRSRLGNTAKYEELSCLMGLPLDRGEDE